MQFCQPIFGPRLSNCDQFNPYSHPLPWHIVYPEIIGEGDVASIIFPDGSVHLYFIPSTYNPSCPCRPPNGNEFMNNNSVGAFYVRSISNPITPAAFSQQYLKLCGNSPRPYQTLFNNFSEPSPAFQLKFHNDCWTSTTDLHYFFPINRRCEWFPLTQLKQCASVQVDVPVKDVEDGQANDCTKPCACFEIKESKEHFEYKSQNKCSCKKAKCCSSGSSISSKRSKSSLKNKCKKKQKKNVKKTSISSKCLCKKDKLTITYAEQACSIPADQGRKTQTCPSLCEIPSKSHKVNSFAHDRDHKSMNSESSEHLKQGCKCNSTCSSATCCCSDSEIDLD